jgi:hypothetical protein
MWTRWWLAGVAVLGLVDARPAAAQTPPPVAQCAAAALPCVEGARVSLRLDTARGRLKWKWSSGNVVDIRDLSNPTLTSVGYDFCVYDASGVLVLATGVPPGTTCNGKPCWRARPYGYQYRDADGGSFGVTKITLKAALGGRGDKLSLSGGGALLPLPATDPVAPVTTQLVRSDDPTVCWGATINRVR